MIQPADNYYVQSSERLVFRSFTEMDSVAFLPFFDRDDYQRFLAQDISIPAKERSETWIQRQMQRKAERQFGQLAILEKATGEFIGVGGIIARENVNGAEEYEITYSLIPAFWGKGYARELALHFIHFAQENLPIKSVISLIHPENAASIGVAEANGLKRDGEWNFMGMPVLIYRLTFD